MSFAFAISQWMKLRETIYKPLPSDDQDQKHLAGECLDRSMSHEGCRREARSYGTLNLLIASFTIVLSLILLLLVTTHSRGGYPTQHSVFPDVHSPQLQAQFLTPRPWNYSNPSPCGLSVESARQAGCRWSAMTFAWYPAPCYDGELDREFMNLQDWQWWSTEEMREEDRLPRDAILRGDIRKAYMSMEYHKLHCMYTTRKLYRSMMGSALCDNYILTLGHLEHCERFVLRNDTPAVKGVAKYLDCVVP